MGGPCQQWHKLWVSAPLAAEGLFVWVQGSSLGQTFRVPPDKAQPAEEAPGSEQPAAQQGGAGLLPVDPDLNLVQSLLASYDAQQGLPGPAGNLATALGLQLHTEAVPPQEHGPRQE